MSKAGRTLKVGDKALTDYPNRGVALTPVTITRRASAPWCQSGIMFCVTPTLKGYKARTQFDADWFEPVPGKSL